MQLREELKLDNKMLAGLTGNAEMLVVPLSCAAVLQAHKETAQEIKTLNDVT